MHVRLQDLVHRFGSLLFNDSMISDIIIECIMYETTVHNLVCLNNIAFNPFKKSILYLV